MTVDDFDNSEKVVYWPVGNGCKTFTIGNEYEIERVDDKQFMIYNDLGNFQFYNYNNFSKHFKKKTMGKVYTVQKIQQTIEEMMHWQSVVYLPLNADASIISAKYLDDESKVEIKFVVDRNGSPENKKLLFSESRFAEIMADFKYDDSIQTVKTEMVVPKEKIKANNLSQEEVAVLEESLTVKNFEKQPDTGEEKTIFQDLYSHLFATITLLKEGKITSEAAKSTAVVAQTVINLARLELEYTLNDQVPAKK
jgi:hypothetical protein